MCDHDDMQATYLTSHVEGEGEGGQMETPQV